MFPLSARLVYFVCHSILYSEIIYYPVLVPWRTLIFPFFVTRLVLCGSAIAIRRDAEDHICF